jgi:NADPH:quinone reductase-like Zn-dependent oxidoreductase
MWRWNVLPNGRHAYFYNVWGGRAFSKSRFRARLRTDLSQVFEALRRGDVTAQVAAELPLARAADALRLAESRAAVGKVILVP